MNAISFADARRRFAEVIEQAKEQPVFITHAGDETMVILKASELSSYVETAYLMSNDANRAELLAAIEDHKNGRPGTIVSPDDL